MAGDFILGSLTSVLLKWALKWNKLFSGKLLLVTPFQKE